MNRLAFDYTDAKPFIDEAGFEQSVAAARTAHDTLIGREGKGNDFLGWIDLPARAFESIEQVSAAASSIRETADALIVIGIGGSYLGARAVIEACTPPFERSTPDIVYAGHHMSGAYLERLLRSLDGRSVAVNVISKSGTTTEPALAFRVIKQWMERRYGREEAARRIIATTDARRGALRTLAEQEGYRTFDIPDDVGGRFSVFSPVGLLPIAAAGVDVMALLAGVGDVQNRVLNNDPVTNPGLMYAAMRTALYRAGKTVEILASFEPALHSVAEWWKQLFGESEGKDGKGIFPAAVTNTTDLHSMGQYIQDGLRNVFETFLTARDHPEDLVIPGSPDDADGLNYLSGRTFSEVNHEAYRGTALAHAAGGVPCMTISLPSITPYTLGELLYFHEYAVAVSGYALGINPFDQPGVEEYKRNMFALLRKPGFEAEHARLSSLLSHDRPFMIE